MHLTDPIWMTRFYSVSPDFDPEDFGEMNHAIQKKLFVGVLLENGKPGIASANDMIASSGIFNAQRSWHGESCHCSILL